MYEIEKISDRQRAMMRDIVLNGMSHVEASAKYDVTQQHLSVITNSPMWKKEAMIMHDNIVGEYKGQLMTMVPAALKNVREIMERTSTFDIIDPNTGNSRQSTVTNPPACRLKASELVLTANKLAGKDIGDGGAKSIQIQLVQPAWGNSENKATTINVGVK